MQLVLYTAIVPAAVVVLGLLALSLARTDTSAGPKPAPTPAERAQQAAADARDDARRQFRECMEGMGADLGRPRFRTRFSARPDVRKIREAAAICQKVLSGGSARPAAERAPSTPPVA